MLEDLIAAFILEHLFRHTHLGKTLECEDGAHDLEVRLVEGLALLGRQEARELVGAREQLIGDVVDQCGTLVLALGRPGRKGLLGCRNRRIELIFVSFRARCNELLSGGIDDVETGGALRELAVDQETI
jgi:hypothetical protein